MHSIYRWRFTLECLLMCWVMAFPPSVRAQVPKNDFYTTTAGTTLSVNSPGILANDGGGGLTAVLVSGPTNGTLSLNSNGSFSYTPATNFTGVDCFTYQAKSGPQLSSPTIVVIMVLAPGGLFYDNFNRSPSTNSPIFPWLIATGSQLEGNWGITNGLMIGTGPDTNYSVAYYPSNSWTDYSVQARVRFSADNAASAGILGRVTTASGSHYSLWLYPENSPEFLASGNGTAVLRMFKYQNWAWPYTAMGNPVTLPAVGAGWHTVKMSFQGKNISAWFDGNLVMTINDNGSIDGTAAYTKGGIGLNLWTLPPANYAFSVDNVIVTTTTNSTANPDAYSAPTNAPLSVAAPGVLANDTGNGPLSVLLAGGPTNGSLTLSNNGGFVYTPANGYLGPDHFTYRCTDGVTTSAVAMVTLTVNRSPLANNDAYLAASNTVLTVSAPGILANDPGGQGTLTAILATAPADGVLVLTNNGGFSYTPTNGFTGTDSFTYRCTDGQSTSGVAIVSLSVIPPIIANNDLYTVTAGTALTVTAPGILTNDLSINSNLTAVLAGGPAFGSLSWGGDGSFRYTPSTNFTGMDGFTYRAVNSTATSGVATAAIMVTPPGGLFDDSFARPAGAGSIFPWAIELGTWGITNNQFTGSSALNNYGYAYYNNPNWTDYSVQMRFRYSSSNAWGGALGGRLNPNNGAHYAAWVYPEGSPWGPQNGAPAGVAELQIIKYENWTAYTAQNLVPLAGVGTNWHTVKLAFQGGNIFAYFDGNLITNLSDNGTVDGQPAFASGGISIDLWTGSTAYTLSASNVVVTPLVINDSYSVNENTPLTVTNPGVLSYDFDVYGTNLTAAVVSGPTNGTLNLNTNGGFLYTPATNFAGTDGFTVQANDRLNHLGTSQVSIAVLPVASASAPMILSYGLTNQVFSVTWSSVNGDTYELQYATNLSKSGWNAVLPDVKASGPTTTETNAVGVAPQEFFRVGLIGP